jgi:hypothetical protein
MGFMGGKGEVRRHVVTMRVCVLPHVAVRLLVDSPGTTGQSLFQLR